MQVVDVFGIRMGLIHGHQIIPWGDQEALTNKAKEMGVKVLISGHSHEIKYTKYKDVHLLNPGSITGAYSSLNLDASPAFIILEVKANDVVVYSYFLSEGELKCVDTKFDKP